jgi:hypothetical protein
MNLLREYIRELLTEAAMGPADLPNNVSVVIADKGNRARIFYAMEDSLNPGEWIKARRHDVGVNGTIIVGTADKSTGPCGDAWEVMGSEAMQGWGPMLYDVAMEYATQNGGGLISDRMAVSPHARKVWDYYMSNRGDVTGIQLDDKSNTLTPEEEDNCNQSVALKGVDPKPGGPVNVDWQNSPLSKRYTKPPTTMNALEAAGKLVTI